MYGKVKESFDNAVSQHGVRSITDRWLSVRLLLPKGRFAKIFRLITNARLANAFIEAFCEMKEKDIPIKSWQEYKFEEMD